MKKIWGTIAMLIATFLWGIAFSAQNRGMDFLDPFVFMTMRSVIGSFALAAVIMIFDLFREKRLTIWGSAKDTISRKFLVSGGLWCGVIITAASTTQQYGMKFEMSAGKTGFLTALYIIIVPILGIFFKRRTTLLLWISAVIGIIGAYLLCGGIGNIGKGEMCVIACSFLFSFHILAIDHYAAKCDCVRLSFLQFSVASILSGISSVVTREPWILEKIYESLPFWGFCGVGSSAIAFTLQMVSQKYLHPVTATLLMSLESVFAVLGGWLFLNEMLSVHELIGCTVIFAAVILAQIPVKTSKKIPKKSA